MVQALEASVGKDHDARGPARRGVAEFPLALVQDPVPGGEVEVVLVLHLEGPVELSKDGRGIADAISLLTNSRDAVNTLTISTLPSFAAKWLVLRLGRFRAEHPELDVRLYTNHELVDFTREDVDLAIRLGRPPWPGIRADLLMTEDLFPVCSPRLLQGPLPLSQPADLKRQLLLHDDYMITWSMWLAAAGVRGIRIEDDAIVTDSGCELITRDVRWTKSRVRAVYAHQVGPDARLGGKGNSFWASVMSNDYWPAPTCGR